MLQDEKMEPVKSNVKPLNNEILTWGAATDPGHPGGPLVSVITMTLNCCCPPSVKHNWWINCKYVSRHTQRTRFPNNSLCWSVMNSLPASPAWPAVRTSGRRTPDLLALRQCPLCLSHSAAVLSVCVWLVCLDSNFRLLLCFLFEALHVAPCPLSQCDLFPALSTAPRGVNVWWPAEACCLPCFQLPLKSTLKKPSGA